MTGEIIVHSIRPALAVLISLIVSVLILATGSRHKNLREFWSIIAATSKFAIVISLMPIILSGKVVEYSPKLMALSPAISIVFRVDALGQFYASLSSGLWILTTIYSIGYMRNLEEHNQTRYFFAFAVCVAATVGIAYSGNLFTLFIFYELLSIGAYPLVIHHESDEAMRAGRKYLLYVLFGGVMVLGAMTMTYVLAGTLSFGHNGILAGTASPAFLRLLFLTFVLGFGVKSAIMPLHSWLPSAMVAPTPVSALLHAVAVVKAGVFGMTRLIYNIYGVDLMKELGLGFPLAVVASITILMASVYALRQDNLKRRLAYSTISQLSYIILGLALLTPSGATGGILHIANQAVMKITLFFTAGAIYVHTGKKNISEMRGLGKKMPITMTAFAIAAVGMTGFPPTAGFITKWYLAIGALEAGHVIFVLVLLVSAMLNAAYFLPPVYNAFFKDPIDGDSEYDEAPWMMLGPIIITTILVLVLGAFANLPYTPLALAHVAVREFFGLP
ncbi:Na(+)/H(+) antiporter subunit A [archaeon BMS3Abin16]|nr:Na(+)/H(+) antiporter subunit A [archaeon BMS3Abin16]HDY74284.1 monovalent cation/H+ antiporter subunit D family protein [Euryarchaeota archaeon]